MNPKKNRYARRVRPSIHPGRVIQVRGGDRRAWKSKQATKPGYMKEAA